MEESEQYRLVAALVVAAAVFLVLARADDVAGAAALREHSGAYRGRIVDVYGHVLAHTVTRGTHVQRVYALPSLTVPVGYRDGVQQWHGLEARYDDLLTARSARHGVGDFLTHLRGSAEQGGTLRLTLDARVQRVAGAALGNARGAIVALDPRTGSVLAYTSNPVCSPAQLATPAGDRSCARRPARPMDNRATGRLFAPGSDFKTVTLTAAIDSGRFHLTDTFSGADAFGPSPYFDNSLYPSNVTRADLTTLTLAQALAFSDNFTFAHIGLTLGAPTLLKYAHRYRVGKRIPFDYPVSQSYIANGKSRPTLSELAQASFGGSDDAVTPLQMALIAATIGNHGVMMAPHLVQDEESPTGKVIARTGSRVLSHVMSAAAAHQVTTGLIFVVDHGSGFNAQIAGMKVAGKTGTAASGQTKPNAWFIAFAPARNPVVAVAVLHQFSGEGFQYAAPLARRVMIAALQDRGYKVH